jgi:CxxC motif-containing protein (DUF1111 family)
MDQKDLHMNTSPARKISATALIIAGFLVPLVSGTALADGSGPFDPGVRRGGADAGGPLPGLAAPEQAFFAATKTVFQEIDSVSGTIPGEDGIGLGPRFNLNGCAGCHAFPATGGSSPAVNPQIAAATLDGAHNTIPSFISANGPVREARFVQNRDGSPDGGVHDLFVITGRNDAPGCHIVQPDFATAIRNNNVIFRIPTPTFGAGLVENVSDTSLQAAVSAQSGLASAVGVSGAFNHSGNDGTITRFGWKAQNKSLLIFAGEAYNVEQGVTNEAFPNERENDPACQFNGLPEDGTNLTPAETGSSPAAAFSSDVVNFAAFMRLSAAPAAEAPTASTLNGFKVFQNIGCQACHIVSQTTAQSRFTGQSNTTFQPFSDFAVHAMGSLGDGISQGSASGQEFRSAPLWGVGQRIFMLHDGRTNNIITAIEAHSSNGSEANTVIRSFNALSSRNQQDLINFLRSL